MASALDWLMRQLGGDPEAEGAATTSAAMQPAVLEHLQGMLSDMPGRFGGTSYDPNRSLAQNALDPESLQQATTIGMQVGPAAIRAYHGSPHDFSAFDSSKIGTGEGAQAYGHGLYFAENEGVARNYKNSLTDPKNMTVSMTLDGTPVTGTGWVKVQNAMWDKGDNEGAYLAQMLGDANRYNVRTMGALKKLYNEPYGPSLPWDNPFGDIDGAFRALRSRADFAPERGRMYEVDLHADPARLLDWDKPFMDQPDIVQNTLRAHVGKLEQGGQPIMSGYVRDMNRGLLPGGGTYTGLGRGTPESATEAWRQAGIPGIRYLDQGSRGAGAGSSNYVMFDDKLIEILRKYGLAGLTAGTGAAALGGSAEAAPVDALDRIRRQLGEGAF